jgi:hypothetical protein
MRTASLAFGLGFLFAALVPAALGAELDLEAAEMAFCAAIKAKNPVGVADSFPSDIFGVYCFTRIRGARDTTVVTHAWYRGENLIASVELPVKSASWRTWSHKRMLPEWHGEWRVDVIAEDGSVIASKRFMLE